MSTADVHDVRTSAPSWWDDVLDWTGSVRAVAVLRIALGPITLVHLDPFLRDAATGVAYHDHFWHPFVSWVPELSSGTWLMMLLVGSVAAALMTVGLWTRLATATTFAVVTTNLLLSTTHFRHNRTFLAIVLGGVALLPAGRALSIDAWRARRAGRPLADVGALWPLWLLRVQVCLVYLASGFSKLIDPDWVGGLVLWDRVVRYQHVLDPTPLPAWAIDLLTQRWLYYVAGPVAVAIELFVGVGLFVARTRTAAIWVAIVFHLLIELSASVEVFSLLAIAALAIWVEPSARQHVVRTGGEEPHHHRLAAAVRAGDWFARFRVLPGPPDTGGLVVEAGRGVVHTGTDATLFVAERIPLTFLVAAPVSWWRRRRHRSAERAT